MTKKEFRESQEYKNVEQMSDYEGMILAWQESEADECFGCFYKGTNCNNQCMRIEEKYFDKEELKYVKRKTTLEKFKYV